MAKTQLVKTNKAPAYARDQLASSKQVKRRRLRNIKLWIFFISLLIVVSGVLWLLNYDKFEIKKVEVRGEDVVSESKILEVVNKNLAGKYFWLFPKANIFFYPHQEIEADLLADFSYLREVSISREFPDQLSVQIGERKTKYLWCDTSSAEDCFLVDDSGLLFAKAPRFSDNILFMIESDLKDLALLSRPLDDLSFRQLVRTIDFMPKLLGLTKSSQLKVQSLKLLPLGDFSFIIKDNTQTHSSRWVLMFGHKQNLETLAKNFLAVFSSVEFQTDLKVPGQVIDYMDLRFGKKVFYKFKPLGQNSDLVYDPIVKEEVKPVEDNTLATSTENNEN